MMKSDWWIIAMLFALYTLIYLPAAFAQIEAREFMSIDPQSIMAALEGLTTYPYYNMTRQYHSQAYGWTYFSFNFLILMLAKFFGFTSALATNFIVKIVLFIIGGVMVAAAYQLARRFFSPIFATLLIFAFLVDPMSAHYFVEIHPESFGLLLQLFAVKYLLDVYNSAEFNTKSFFLGITFLSLSALCKQPFFVASVFIYIGFFIAFAWSGFGGIPRMTWKLFGSLTLRGTGLFFLLFFVINPYAFLEFDRFVAAQMSVRQAHAMTDLSQTAIAWFEEVIAYPFILTNFALLALIPFLGKKHLPYLLSVAFTSIVNLIFMLNQSLFVYSFYLYPTQLFMLFNVFYFVAHFIFPLFRAIASRTITSKYVVWISGFASVMLMALFLASNLAYAIYRTHSQFWLDGLDTQRAAWHALSNLPEGTRIAYSPNVAILSPLKETGCHAWQGCSGVTELTAFDPGVVVFSRDYAYFNVADYTKFVETNGFVLSETIYPKRGNFDSQCIANFGAGSAADDASFKFTEFFFHNPVACFEAYQQAAAARTTGNVMRGDSIEIFKKSN